MKTSVGFMRVRLPGEETGTAIKISERGNLMMNRLCTLFRLAKDSAMDQNSAQIRFGSGESGVSTIYMPSRLLISIIEAYIKNSRRIKRKDKKLDELRDEYDKLSTENAVLLANNLEWATIAGQLIKSLDLVIGASQNLLNERGDDTTKEMAQLRDAVTEANTTLDNTPHIEFTIQDI